MRTLLRDPRADVFACGRSSFKLKKRTPKISPGRKHELGGPAVYNFRNVDFVAPYYGGEEMGTLTDRPRV